MRLPAATALALAGLLAACNRGPDQGTSISINATGDDGNMMTAQVNGSSGKVSLAVPGFKGSVSLPKIQLDANDFSLNGVHLYPGSTITSMNVAAQDHGDHDDDSGTVRVAFDSPAAPDTVRDWFRDKLTTAGFTLQPQGTGLAGTTDDGKPFRLQLDPAGDGKAKGLITVTG